MKKAIRFSSALVLFLAVNFTFAGNGTATINEHMQISLAADQPLASVYTFDISSLTFRDEASATQFFNTYADAGITYTVNFQDKIVTMTIGPNPTTDKWTVADYNKYLQMRSMKMEVYYLRLQENK